MSVDDKPTCAWVYDDEDPNSRRCTTGKPALFYNCNESGPVCEDHVCRCRPSLLTERAEKARRDLVERARRGARELYNQRLISTQTFESLMQDLSVTEDL